MNGFGLNQCLSTVKIYLYFIGHGICKCNECQCTSDDSNRLFSGAFCEKYPGEIEPCQILAPCVECLAFESGPEWDEIGDCTRCSALIYAEVTPKELANEVKSGEECVATNANGCKFRYTSDLTSQEEVLTFLHVIDGEREICPKISAAGITLAALAAIILISGLVFLLIWKFCIIISDRRQYAKFEKERQKLQFAANENPNDIYRSPITEYKNPMYVGKDAD